MNISGPGPLEGLHIIDLSCRLPGPLASYKLNLLGARVTKIEDNDYQDPFDLDKGIFKSWYNSLNRNKTIKRISFKNKLDIKLVNDLISHADGVILGLPEKLINKLELDVLSFEKNYRKKVLIKIKASSKNNYPLHDLGALTKSGLLKLILPEGELNPAHIIPPPLLPIAGINFSSEITNLFLAGLFKVGQSKQNFYQTIYLEDSTQNLANALLPDKTCLAAPYEHNGKVSTYNIYRLSDNSYISVSLLEKRFLIPFLEILGKSPEEEVSKQDLISFFMRYNRQTMKKLIKDNQLNCLDFI